MKRTLGDDSASRKLTWRLGDKEIPVKSDSDDSEDEYDESWQVIVLSKASYRRYQADALSRGNHSEQSNTKAPHVKSTQIQPTVIKVTNYVPASDKAANRERSIQALEDTRNRISDKTGRPHRLIVDPGSGMLLSRDTVDTRLYDEGAQAESTDFHYKSSVRALERLRDLRLMRKLDDALGE